MINKDVEKKYTEVQDALENALIKANSIELTGDEENVELSVIIHTLEELNNNFKKEIETLKNSSEWDKFCIAFFGETNAGKSTIIESLRIIYNEETRRAEVLAKDDEYHSALRQHCADYKELIASLEEVNVALKAQYGKFDKKWLFCIVAGLVGVAAGLILANMGIVVW